MMARAAAHENFVHALETFAAFAKANPDVPVPVTQTVIKAHVRTSDQVHDFAKAHNLGPATVLPNAGKVFIDVPFGALIYRVQNGGE